MLTKKQILASIQKSLISYKKDVLDSLYSKVNHTHSEYVNPSCYGSIKVGSSTVSADSSQDTLTFANGDGISLQLASPSASEDKITITNSGVRSIATGSSNGTISVNTNGKSADVSVKGLGSAAYTSSSNYATSGHTHNNYAKSNHTHNYAGSSSAGGVAKEAAKVSHSLQISGNGGLLGIYDGSADKTVNITPSVIGAAKSDHSHNNIMSKGIVAAQTKNTRPTESGISMQNAANNGYPSTYGNIINLKGDGDGQIFVGWSGTSGAHAPVYVRSRRDVDNANWSGWAQFYTTANKPTASDIGAATSTHSHTSMGVNDTRNNNENPTALCANSQIRADFKMPSKINLTGSSASYVGTITFRPFGSANDWSGGKATQLAFADEGNVFMRKGTGTTWSDWTQFYTSSNKPKASDIGAAASSHTHNYAGSSSAGGAATSANKVNSTLTIQGNGKSLGTFNGSANKTVNITAENIGATTKSYVDTAINNALGDIATILTEINGE